MVTTTTHSLDIHVRFLPWEEGVGVEHRDLAGRRLRLIIGPSATFSTGNSNSISIPHLVLLIITACLLFTVAHLQASVPLRTSLAQ